MKLPVILILALIGSSFAVETENPLSIVLAQVSDHPFGNAIGSLIQLHLQEHTAASAPSGKINAIINLLTTLRNTITKGQEGADTRYTVKDAWCSDTIAQLEKELESATRSSGRAGSEYNDLAKAQADLEAENNGYGSRAVDYSEAIAACQEAIRLLLSLGNKAQANSFVQVSQNFGSIKDKLETHAKNAHIAFVEPILDVLSQLANGSQYDYSKITAIVDLIRTLLQNLQGASAELESNHGKVVNDLASLIQNLSSQIETLKVNVGVLDTRLGEIEKRLAELQPLIAQYDTLVDVTRKMNDGTKSDCTGATELHKAQQASRAKQLAILDRLIEYFDSQVKGRAQQVLGDDA